MSLFIDRKAWYFFKKIEIECPGEQKYVYNGAGCH